MKALDVLALLVLGSALVSAGPADLPLWSRNHRSVANALARRQSAGSNNTTRRRRGPGGECASAPASPSPSPSPPVAGYSGCFPSLGFQMPDTLPDPSVLPNNWWCDRDTEYAFVGFSYSVEACQSRSQLRKEFSDIRNRFHGRYVRLYGSCDNKGFYDDVVAAAWDAGIGVHALIWFGFDGGDIWKTRRDALFSSLQSNPKARFVTRVVQFGSEPLFDSAISPQQLAQQVLAAKASLANLHIPITVSDMAYGFQERGGAQQVLDAVDFINAHTLPFFSSKASTGRAAWPLVQPDLQWFVNKGKGKKIYLSENGWPSVTSPGVSPNSGSAVANVQNEHDYFAMLDSHCSDFKNFMGVSIGWFAHIYSEDQGPGYGVLDSSGQLKFAFHPRTSC